MILIATDYDRRDWADYLEALKRFGGVHPAGNGSPVDNVSARPSRNWRGVGPKKAHSNQGRTLSEKASKTFVDGGWGAL